MDATEARLSRSSKDKGSPGQNTKLDASEAAEIVPSNGADDANEFLSTPSESVQQPLPVTSYMDSLALLGRVLRNSEFTSKIKKEIGIKLYLSGASRLFLHIDEMIFELFKCMVDVAKEEDELLDEKSVKGLRYYLTKKVMLFIGEQMNDDLATRKLVPTMEGMIVNENISLVEKTFLVSLQLDCPNDRWGNHWKQHAQESGKQRLPVEFLTDKLWKHIHSKALSVKEQENVAQVAYELERSLGASKSSKGIVLEGIRSAAKKATREVENNG